MIPEEDRIYTYPNNQNHGTVVSIDKQSRVMDMLGENWADRQIARRTGVSASTVKRIRLLHGLPVADSTPERRNPVRTPIHLKDEAVVLRLQGYLTHEIVEKLGIGRNVVQNYTTKFMPLSGITPKSTTNRQRISRREAERLWFDILLCRWRRSAELATYMHDLDKRNKEKRIQRDG